MKAQLVKPVKHDLSSRSSVFTPVLPISKTEILSGKYHTGYYQIAEFYRIPVSGHPLPVTGDCMIQATGKHTQLRFFTYMALFRGYQGLLELIELQFASAIVLYSYICS